MARSVRSDLPGCRSTPGSATNCGSRSRNSRCEMHLAENSSIYSYSIYVRIFFNFKRGLPLTLSRRLACCWRMRQSSLRKCSSSRRSFAWKRKSISRMTSVVTDLLMSFFNTSLLSVTTSARTSPIRERTCSS